jgi:phenolic acid decarboxylase
MKTSPKYEPRTHHIRIQGVLCRYEAENKGESSPILVVDCFVRVLYERNFGLHNEIGQIEGPENERESKHGKDGSQ